MNSNEQGVNRQFHILFPFHKELDITTTVFFKFIETIYYNKTNEGYINIRGVYQNHSILNISNIFHLKSSFSYKRKKRLVTMVRKQLERQFCGFKLPPKAPPTKHLTFSAFLLILLLLMHIVWQIEMVCYISKLCIAIARLYQDYQCNGQPQYNKNNNNNNKIKSL